MLVYKICPAAMWREGEREGVFRGSPIDLQDGYIHFSTADQVEETLSRHFAGQRDLLLVHIDATQLSEHLKWEPSRGGALFPHLYDVLNLAAVTKVEALPLGAAGKHLLPQLGT